MNEGRLLLCQKCKKTQCFFINKSDNYEYICKKCKTKEIIKCPKCNKEIEEKHESREKDECICENCGYYPLKHCEHCPECHSEGFHITIKKSKVKK